MLASTTAIRATEEFLFYNTCNNNYNSFFIKIIIPDSNFYKSNDNVHAELNVNETERW